VENLNTIFALVCAVDELQNNCLHCLTNIFVIIIATSEVYEVRMLCCFKLYMLFFNYLLLIVVACLVSAYDELQTVLPTLVDQSYEKLPQLLRHIAVYLSQLQFSFFYKESRI
jgi:hypothetical protein